MPDIHTSQLRLAAAAFESVSNGLFIVDHEEHIVLWNAWMSRHAGLLQEAVHGKTLIELFPDLLETRLHQAVRAALREGHPSLLSQTLNKAPLPLFPDASSRQQRQRIQQAIQVIPLKPEGMERYCLVQINDVSFSVARERLLRDQAIELRAYSHLDSLTSIPNRRRLDEYLLNEMRRAVRSAMPIAVIMLDIDYFKRYNDAYGHQMGDQCLIQVAAALEASIKRPGDLVARYGGEEFVVVLVDTDRQGAAGIAAKMRACIENLAIEHAYSPVSPHVTISLGVTSAVPGQACEPSMLIVAADRALYQAKHDGRNCVRIYDPETLCGVRKDEVSAVLD